MQILGYTGYVLRRDRVPSKWLVEALSEKQSGSGSPTLTATQAALHTGRPVEVYIFIYPAGKASA